VIEDLGSIFQPGCTSGVETVQGLLAAYEASALGVAARGTT